MYCPAPSLHDRQKTGSRKSLCVFPASTTRPLLTIGSSYYLFVRSSHSCIIQRVKSTRIPNLWLDISNRAGKRATSSERRTERQRTRHFSPLAQYLLSVYVFVKTATKSSSPTIVVVRTCQPFFYPSPRGEPRDGLDVRELTVAAQTLFACRMEN